MEKRFRVKILENFKDGNILGGKFLPANSFHVVTERESELIQSSGGVLEIIEMVIPNPRKAVEPEPEKVEKPAEPQLSSYTASEPASGEAKPGQTVTKSRKAHK